MAQSQHFSPDDFTPTKFSTDEQKAAFSNQLLAFIAAGFPKKKFTNALYERLSNCFGFIAHYAEYWRQTPRRYSVRTPVHYA
jgi:hypothetical protein